MDATTTDAPRQFTDHDDWPDEINVHKIERMASVSIGMVIAGFAVLRRGLLGATFGALGGALIHRGLTGHCHLYKALRVSTAHGVRGPSASVPHGQGVRVRHSLSIRQSPEQLYHFWHQLENLPSFMRHIESVAVLDSRRSRWRAKGPADQTIEWYAEIINDVENELIAWRSLPGAVVPNAGSVRFERAVGGHATTVTVTLEYDPPGGVIGTAIARWLGADPAKQVEEDLLRIKQLFESGEVPALGAQWRGRLGEFPDLETARQVLEEDAAAEGALKN